MLNRKIKEWLYKHIVKETLIYLPEESKNLVCGVTQETNELSVGFYFL